MTLPILILYRYILKSSNGIALYLTIFRRIDRIKTECSDETLKQRVPCNFVFSFQDLRIYVHRPKLRSAATLRNTRTDCTAFEFEELLAYNFKVRKIYRKTV